MQIPCPDVTRRRPFIKFEEDSGSRRNCTKLLSGFAAFYTERGADNAVRHYGFKNEKDLQGEILGYTIKCNEETVRGKRDSPYLF